MNYTTNLESSIYSCPVPFHLTDPGGKLFFGHTFSLFHQAFEHFVCHELHCTWNEWFQNPIWIVPIVHTEANYLSPIVAGKECKIEIALTKYTQSSFSLHAKLSQSTLCCTIQTVHVFCDPLTQTKIPIPSRFLPIFKDKLEK